MLSLALGLRFAGNGYFAPDVALEAGIFVLISAGVVALAGAVSRLYHMAQESERHAELRGREALDVAEELNLLIDGAETYAIYMLDATGHVTIWNSGAERLKGWSEAEVIGKHMSLFYPRDAIAAGKPEADLARATAEGRFEDEDWRLRKDGSKFSPTSRTPRYMTIRAGCVASPRLFRTLPSSGRHATTCARAKASSGRFYQQYPTPWW
jgi:two-component system sensor kinase FixL